MSGEIDFEPFETQAFPGVEFFFSGDRDNLTVNAYEPAHARRTPILSVARQGYLIRHPLPGAFTPLTPDEAGLLPINDAAPRRPSAVPRRESRPVPPAPRDHITPTIPLPNGVQSRLINRDHCAALQVFIGGLWRDILRFPDDSGRLTRVYHFGSQIDQMRRFGFTMSRDGAIAIINPTPRARNQSPPEHDLEAQPPIHRIPDDLPFEDRILAVHERFREMRDFIHDNASLLEAIRTTQRRQNIQNTPSQRILIPASEELEHFDKCMVGLLELNRILALPETEHAALQGGGEGGVGVGGHAIPIPFRPYDYHADFGAQPQWCMTADERNALENHTPSYAFPVPGRFGSIITFKAYPRALNDEITAIAPVWYELDEQRSCLAVPYRRLREIPIAGDAAQASQDFLFRMLRVQHEDGTEAIYPLTEALDRRLREIMASNPNGMALINDLEDEDDPDYPDYDPDEIDDPDPHGDAYDRARDEREREMEDRAMTEAEAEAEAENRAIDRMEIEERRDRNAGF